MAKRKGKGRRAGRSKMTALQLKYFGGGARKRQRSSRRASSGSAAPLVVLGPGGSFRRKFGGSNMANKRRRRSGVRRRSGRRFTGGGGGGGRGALGGFFSRDVMATVGGAVAAGVAGPLVARMLPSQLVSSQMGQVAGAAIVGFVGYFALKRFSRSAALGWAAASLAPVVSSFIPRNLIPGGGGTQGLAYGYPDELAGMGYSGVADGTALVDRSMSGIGDYTDEAVEMIPAGF